MIKKINDVYTLYIYSWNMIAQEDRTSQSKVSKQTIVTFINN